jgi:WD40 repeat protein
MYRSVLISSISLPLLAGLAFICGLDAQEPKLPTDAEVKALQSKYQAERRDLLKTGIDKRFPPDLLKRAEDLAGRADKALIDGRLFQASEDYRQARWMLPYQPPQVPAKHVARILGTLRFRHNGEVTAIAFSPDGKFLASAGKDHTVKIWDLENGHERVSYTGHTTSVWAIAFSPDGTAIASGAAEPDIRLWDPMTGKDQRTITGNGAYIYSLAYMPDGKYLVSGQARKELKDNDLLCIHEVDSGKLVRTTSDFRTKPHSLSFSPDGSLLAVATSHGEIRLFNCAQLLTHPAYWTQQHDSKDDWGCQAAISPDNRTLIRCGEDGVKLYKVPQPKDRFEPKDESKILSLGQNRGICATFSRDGKTIIVGCNDGVIRLFDAGTITPTGLHKGHAGPVTAIAINPAGNILASAGSDHTVRLWQNEVAMPARDYAGHEGSVWKSSFSPDGRRIVSASADRSVRIWDVAGAALIHKLIGHTAPVTGALFSPDGKFIASAGGDRVIKIWDAESGKHLHDLPGHASTITCLDFSSDGKKLATGGIDRKLKVWDLEERKELLHIENGTFPAAVVFSPNGKQIASGNVDASIKFYDAGSGKLQSSWSAHGSSVTGLAYSPDGKMLASSGADQLARIWNVAKPGAALMTLTGHNGPVSGVAFRKDGRHVATCGSDMLVRLWKLDDNGSEIQAFRGHKDWLTSVNFSKDGYYLVSSGVDRIIKVNEITTQDIPIVSEQIGNVMSVAVSPDGKYIASGGTDRTIKIWDRATGGSVANLLGHEGAITALVFSADSKRLISGCEAVIQGGKTRQAPGLKVWDIATAREIEMQPAQQQNWARLSVYAALLSIAPDDSKLFMWQVGGEEQEKSTRVSAYDLAMGTLLFTFVDPGREVRAAALSANGKTMAIASKEGTVRLFDLDKKGQGFPGGDWFLYEKDDSPTDIALSSNGDFLVAGSVSGEIRICKVAGKEVVHSIRAHKGAIQCCLVSPDGKTVASAGQDNLVKLWDLTSGKELRSWSMEAPGSPTSRVVTYMTFTPDSKQLVTSNGNTTLYVLELP